MKRKLIRVISAAAISGFLLTSCNSKKGTENNESVSDQTEFTEVKKIESFANVSEELKGQIKSIIRTYIELKDALVGSKTEEAKKSAEAMLAEISKIDFGTIPSDQKSMVEAEINTLKSKAESVKGASTIEAQREALPNLTAATYTLTKAFAANNEDLFYQHCPMAFDGKGGDWLSQSQKIENPYFGEKMLACGENKEKLSAH
jgi:hypothetical protein